MHRTTRTLVLALPAAGLLASAASAQVASALLREDDPLPPTAAFVSSISNTAVNQLGGYSITVNDDASVSHVWGDPTGVGLPTILRSEGTFGPLVQTSFESFFGMADGGELGYSATGTGGPDGGFDSVWLDSTPIAVEGDPTGFDANFWSFASRPGITAGGTPYFVGGTRTTVSGSTANRGLYFGDPAMPVMQGGDLLPNLPFALSTSTAVDFDYRYSAQGTHSLVPVDLETASSADAAMTLDGEGLILGGTLVQEGNVIPVSVGGDGVETYVLFDFCGVTESGEYFFTGDTSGDTATDEFVLVNGLIVHREGDTLDGRDLTGAIEGAFMNEAGQLAFVWDVVEAASSLEALYVEGELVLLEGDPVDWDGDGLIDAGTALTDFTGISALTLGPNLAVYFTADVDVSGTVLEGFFCMLLGPDPIQTYCAGDGSLATMCPCANESGAGSGEGCANSSGLGALLTASGSASVLADDLTLTVAQVPANQNGILYSGFNPVELPFGDGIRCVNGAIVRFPVRNAGPGGSYAESNVASFLGAMSGDLRYLQGWFRDPGGPCGQTFNFSNALSVEFQP